MFFRFASIPHLSALVVAAQLLLTASGARADEREDRAFALFEQAEAAYSRGALEEAVRLLLEARQLVREPALLYNLGRAYEGLGRSREALEAYRSYLAEAEDAPHRGAIQRRIEAIEGELAARREADQARERAQRRAAEMGHSDPVGAWVIGGVGLAGLIAASGLGAGALVDEEAARNADSHRDGVARLERAETLATSSNVLFVAGGVVLAAAIVWLVVELATEGPAEAPLAARDLRFAF